MKSLKIITATVSLGLAVSLSTPVHAQAPTFQDLSHLAWTQPKLYAHSLVKQEGWEHKHYVCLVKLWGKESAWNYKADNPHSTAYGIAQMLGEKSKSPVTQIQRGIRYIKHRYDKPCAAWKFWQTRKWY
jgi:hypothetical protein